MRISGARVAMNAIRYTSSFHSTHKEADAFADFAKHHHVRDV